MNTRIHLLALAAVVVASCGRSDHGSVSASPGQPSTKQDPTSGKTATTQSNAQADLDHLAEIRRALVADGALSVAATNVQVMTKDGHVVLRGRVASTTERAAVERHARASVATRSVDDQIEIESR